MKQKNWLKILSCTVFAGLYLIVAIISLICSTEFFKLAHSGIMSWVLAIGFEIGAMACLLSTLILPKKKLGLVWFMFIVLTLFQCMGNMYAAFINLQDFKDWIDMFGMQDMEVIAQKRVLSAISGIILPLVALGFIRIMADVLQDSHEIEINDSRDAQNSKMLFTLDEEKGVQNESETPEILAMSNTVELDPEPAKENHEETVVEQPKEIKEEDSKQKVEKEERQNESKNKPVPGRIWNPQLNVELG